MLLAGKNAAPDRYHCGSRNSAAPPCLARLVTFVARHCDDKQYTLVSLPCCPYLQINEQKEEVKKKLRERRVPSSAFGRAAGFAGMGASLVFGSMRDSVSTFWTAMYCGIT